MNKHLWIGLLVTAAGAAAVGCSDDDLAPVEVTPDAGETPQPDAGTPTDGAAPDPDAGPIDPPGRAAITPSATLRLADVLNPYGLTFGTDGALYASGAIDDGGVRKLAVWRIVDGELDATFGTDGVVSLDMGGAVSSFDIVEIEAGKFVVQAVSGGQVWLVPLAKDGGGAFTFGEPVKVALGWADGNLVGWDIAGPPPAYNSWGIGLDTSGAKKKIVVFAAGAPPKAASGTQRTDNDRWIARVLADTLEADPDFNGGEAFSVDADGAGLPDNARRGLVLPDGSIISSGYTNFGASAGNHVVVLRLKADGTPDPAFGFGTATPLAGQAKFNPYLSVAGFSEAYAVGQQSSGRLVTTGYGTSNADAPSVAVDLVSFGVKADGLDTSFGTLGAFAWQSETDKMAGVGNAPYSDRGRDLVVLHDDRTVHVGNYDDHAAIFVLDKDGTPDMTAGKGGRFDYAHAGAFFKVALSPDGKRLAATTQSVKANDAAPPVSLLVTFDIGK